MNTVETLKYIQHYPANLQQQALALLQQDKLGDMLLKRYPELHNLSSDRALYDFTMELKNRFMKKSQPLAKAVYDDKVNALQHALGTHTRISRVQGNRLKGKREIRIDSCFRRMPLPFLKMIVVHELAHFKESDHNKAFYKLCQYMEPDYHQLEFDLRLYLTQLEFAGPVYK